MKIIFEKEIEKEENKRILSHLNKLKDLSKEEIKQLKLIVLWRSIETFNVNKGCKFTTHLYNTCRFTYLKHINKRKEVFLEQREQPYSIQESILENLPDLYKTVLFDRYNNNFSIREMSVKYRMNRKQVKILIEDSINYIKNNIDNLM